MEVVQPGGHCWRCRVVVSFAERRRTALCVRVYPQSIGPIPGGTPEVAGAGRPYVEEYQVLGVAPRLPASVGTTAFFLTFFRLTPIRPTCYKCPFCISLPELF